MVESPEFTGAFNCLDVFRLLDDTDEVLVAARVAADVAADFFGDVEADLAEANSFLYLEQNLREFLGLFIICLQQVERNALGRFWANTRKPAQFVDKFLDYTLVH
jgi:hypothetical protein